MGRRCPFIASYLAEHPGYYLTGDGGYIDEDGYLFVMGRIDDVINVAGHRMSTRELEAVLAAHPAVAECAVIGVADEIKGQVPRGLVVLKTGASADGLAAELVAAVRNEIGAVACFKLVDVVAALPKTHTAKTNPCPRRSRILGCSTHCDRFCSRELSLGEHPGMNVPTIPVTDTLPISIAEPPTLSSQW